MGPAGVTPVSYQAGRHLDTYTSTGVYINEKNDDARAELGWPTQLAALLLVFTLGGFVYQVCLEHWNGGFYVRAQYRGTWRPWRTFVQK